MTGYDDYNYPAFYAAAAALRANGHMVFNPAEHDLLLYGSDFLDHKERFDFRKTLEDDLRWICRHAEAIALLPGWEESKGAKVEKAVAEVLGLEVIYLDSSG